ncbi:hypothetical protein [Thermaurantimonas aggregans]|uniref:hypothetical protein n=1 Tax=Thermaurantimonas aggregans TaxID=2173829 RepID=UPI0023F2DD42|nr:hypothetical protein [Thermaurantimonas aggregans]MCX8148346.1 hypothetical protein [Thermaurantimonas aggregans]
MAISRAIKWGLYKLILLLSLQVYSQGLPTCSIHTSIDHKRNLLHVRVNWKNLPTRDTVWFYYMPQALADEKSFYSREQDEYQNAELYFFREKRAFQLPTFEENHQLIRHPLVSEVFGLYNSKTDSITFTFTVPIIQHPFPVTAMLQGGDILLQFFYPQWADGENISPFNAHLYLNLPRVRYSMTLDTDVSYSLLAPGIVISEYLDTAVRWKVEADSLQHLNLFLTRTLIRLPSVRGKEHIAVYARPENISKLSNALQEITAISKYLEEEYRQKSMQNLQFVDVSSIENRIFPNGYWLPIRMPVVSDYLPASLATAYFEALCARYVYGDRWKFPVFYSSIAEYFKYEYIKKYHPEIQLAGPLANSWVGSVFGLQYLPYHYQNQLIYLFTERQGLSQPLSDVYSDASRLHLDGAGVAKYVTSLFHLKGYLGDFKFRKLIYEALSTAAFASPERFHQFLSENHHKSLDWFTDDIYAKNKKLDYALLNSLRCNYTQVVTVKNKGKTAAPIPISGIKDGKIFITQWFEGHRGTKKIPIHIEEFERIIIDAQLITPEINHHNNQIRTSGMFRRFEPLKLQFYTGLEDPLRNQLYWFPMVNYNAYDQILLGLSLYNNGLLLKKYEYLISPQFSTGTGKLTGTASFTANYALQKGPFHMIRAGIFYKYFHYDRQLAFSRWSPTVRLWWRKANPRSKTFHITRLRYVDVQRELPPDFQELPVSITNASYGVFSLNYTMEYTSILRPTILKLNAEHASAFTKVFGEWDQRWMLPNKKWLIARVFYGQFLRNNIPAVNAFYNFGMSGTLDYNFDFLFYGRSDSTGIWSQQMFVTDGGFRAATGLFAQRWMATANLSVPVWKFFGLYGDIGFSDRVFAHGAGIRLAFVTDFLELYFPLYTSHTRAGINPGYLPTIRFLINPDVNAIQQRLRRGWF